MSSLAGLMVPFAIAKFAKIDYVSVWLATRAGGQVLLTVLPNPANDLFSRGDKGQASKEIEEGLVWFYLKLSVLVFPLAFLAVIGFFGSALTRIQSTLLSFYAFLFVASSLFSVLLRVRRRGDLIRDLANQDIAFSVLAIIAVYFDFAFLVLVFLVRELIRIATIAPLLGTPKRRPYDWRMTYRSSGWIYARNVVQVLSQYAERLVIPALFGLTISGYAGLGSTLGVSLVMLSSTLYVWGFNEILESSGQSYASERIMREFWRLSLASSSLCWAILAISGLFRIKFDGLLPVAFTASFSSSLGIGFLILARSRHAMTSMSAAALHLVSLGAIYAAVAFACKSGMDYVMALLLGTVVYGGYIIYVSRDLKRRERRAIVIATLVQMLSCAAANAFVVSGVDISSFLGVIISLIVSAALVMPYGIYLLRGKLL